MPSKKHSKEWHQRNVHKNAIKESVTRMPSKKRSQECHQRMPSRKHSQECHQRNIHKNAIKETFPHTAISVLRVIIKFPVNTYCITSSITQHSKRSWLDIWQQIPCVARCIRAQAKEPSPTNKSNQMDQTPDQNKRYWRPPFHKTAFCMQQISLSWGYGI